jgi:adenylate cyclase
MHCEHGREWSRAVTYLQAAAERATEQYAHREAVDYLRRALSGLERLAGPQRPVDELALLASLGVHLQVTRGFAAPEVQQVHERAHAICRTLDDPRRTFPVLWGIWLFKKVRSDLREAWQLAQGLLAMAQQLAEPAFALQAQQSVAVTSLCLGEFAATRDAMQRAQALYAPARFDTNTHHFGQDPCVACLAFGSIALHLTGDADGSARAGERSLELARELGQPSSMALALHFSAMLHQLRGDPIGAGRQASRAVELAAWEDFSLWHAGGRILRAWAAAAEGGDDVDASIAEMRAGIDAWLATGSRTYHTYFLGLLADALLRHDRAAEALEVLEGALELVRELDEGLHHAELHRLTARCLVRSRQGNALAGALEQLEQASCVARRQGAAFVLRQIERDRELLTRPTAARRDR